MDTINILIVEDDPIIAADIQDRLQEIGYEVLGPISRGEDALTFFDNGKHPDLVVMDIHLAGNWDGIETTRHIQAKNDVPVIFLTSNSDDATFGAAKQVKPQAFLSKPFRGRDLKHAIELAISKAAVKSVATANEPTETPTYLLRDRLFIKAKDRMVRLFFKDILWVEADNYYCKVVTKEREFLVTMTLKKFSEELVGVPELMRVHRSFIVNLSHVAEIGELYLHIGKGRIPFSKNFKEEMLGRLRNA